MRTIPADVLKALFAQRTEYALIPTLKINHSSLGSPLYFIRDKRDYVDSGASITYKALGFDLQLPPDVYTEVPQAQLIIDNTTQALVDLLRSVSDQPTVDIAILAFDGSNIPTTMLGPYTLSMLSYTNMQATSITIALGYKNDILNQAATKDHFTPSLAPGMF